MKIFTCRWCGQQFERTDGPGRPPQYCSASHRQQAYQARQQSRAATQALASITPHFTSSFVTRGAPDMSFMTELQDSIAASLPDMSFMTELQDSIAASLPDMSFMTELQDSIAASLPDMSFMTELQDSIAASLPDMSFMTELQDSIAASLPDIASQMAMSNSLIDYAVSALNGVRLVGLSSDMTSAIDDIMLRLPDVEFTIVSDEDDTRHLETSVVDLVDEQLQGHPELAEIVGPDNQGIRTRVYLSLLVCLSIPLVLRISSQILTWIIDKSFFYLRLLGVLPQLDPAIGGITLIYTIAHIVNGLSNELLDSSKIDDP